MAQDIVAERAAPLANRWWIVAACAAGLMVGTGSILILSFGIFLKPVTTKLGFSRGAFSASLLVTSAGAVIFTPIFGRFLDRYGIRRACLPMVIVLSLCIASLGLIGPSLWPVYLIFVVASIGGPAQSPMTYSKAVAAWFDKERGLALGIATTGSGIGSVLMPLEAQYLIDHFGWRFAYFGLGLTNFVIAFLAFALVIRDPPGQLRRANEPMTGAEPPGMTGREALRSWRLWSIAAIFLIGGATVNGALAHVAALLTDRGVPADTAALVLSSSGIAIIGARIFGGWLLDRLYAPYVGAIVLLLPALGCALLAAGYGGMVPTIAVLLCGAGLGVEIDMMGFFVSRYFGIRHFGEIYAYMFVGFAIGVGAGPALMGFDYDRTHSYDLALTVFTGLLLVASVLTAQLGPYAFPKTENRR
jgi:predicted MFS family arabinose efflux permease